MNLKNNLNSGLSFQGLKYKGDNDINPTKTGGIKDRWLMTKAVLLVDEFNKNKVDLSTQMVNGVKTITFIGQDYGQLLLTLSVSPDEKEITFITKQPNPKKPNSGEKVVLNCMEYPSQLFYDLINLLKKIKG